MDRLDKACHYVLQNEDGKPWDRDDGCFTWNPGGHSDPPTKWGVILEEYQQVFGPLKFPDGNSVKSATRDQALIVYKDKFWGPIKGDSYLEEHKAIAIMDTAVNKGLGGCKRILEDTLGKTFVGAPWVYGPDLIAAVNAPDPQAFLDSFSAAVKRYIDARISENPAREWARAGWNARASRLIALMAWSPQ